MSVQDHASEIAARMCELEEGESIVIADVTILDLDYTVRITQPEAGLVLSTLGLRPYQEVVVEVPNGNTRSFRFDPTGPRHDACDKLRESLFEIHRKGH